ncbi:hypothetical protein ACFSCX_05880 [Bacillus salitolerans]|uniref:Uncharacterized protein n=1 Tax=Bacillus salitolerans TaxID=1437434 RepID=A0ABW4LPR6_9BACI
MHIQPMLDLAEVQTDRTYGSWIVSYKGDQDCRKLADRHYNRIKYGTVGSPHWTRPGDNLILRNADCTAVWVSWRSKYKRKDSYGYAWENVIFRNESTQLSSELIKMAMFATVKEFGELPHDGFITYIDSEEVGTTHNHNPGYCYLKSGFVKQPKKSSKGLICYKTDQAALDLVLKEMGVVYYLEYCKHMIVVALRDGDFMEAEWFQEEAENQLEILADLREEMKNKNLKAWSSFSNPCTKLDLHMVTDPYCTWHIEDEYLKAIGLAEAFESFEEE